MEFMSYGCAHCAALEPVLEQVAQMLKATEQGRQGQRGGGAGARGRLSNCRYANSGHVSERRGSGPHRRTPALPLTVCWPRSRSHLRPDMSPSPDKPILLYNDECAVCRHIAPWVQKSAPDKAGQVSIVERPIGDDPEALRALNPDLDIWQAYETVHELMPDGSMRLGAKQWPKCCAIFR